MIVGFVFLFPVFPARNPGNHYRPVPEAYPPQRILRLQVQQVKNF
jgi:hypothetical protein